MQRLASFALAACFVACSNDSPPPIQDSDSSIPEFDDDAYRPPVFVDAGGDGDAGGSTEVLDFEGTCNSSGMIPIWHYFDFQTHTPEDSSLTFTAQSADTEDALGSAPSVELAVVTGPDITTWTGVDVDGKLQSIGQVSHLFLRVSIALGDATDGTPPVLVHYRQEYDCVVGQ